MSEYTQVDLQIGTEAQFETKKATLPEGVIVGLTDPIHENELDSALQTKLNDKASTSYVQGNPTESGTVDLTKLKIGNTVYNVPQGGGSNVEVVQTTGQSTTAVMSQKAVTDELDGKVDKVTGQGLSTNDFTNDEKNKLAGIETGAQKNTITGVKGSAETSYRTGNVNITKTNIGLGNVDNVKQYSANNPNFGSTSPLMDGTASVGSATTYARSDHKHPTDTSRASTSVATTSANGLMSSLDKTKLDGIEEGAEVNKIDTITAGSNVTISKSGKTVTISATGGGGGTTGVSSLGGQTGAITLGDGLSMSNNQLVPKIKNIYLDSSDYLCIETN